MFLAPGKSLTPELLERAKDPLISPIYGDICGFPSLLIQYGDRKILKSNILEFADWIKEHQSSNCDELVVCQGGDMM